VVLALLPGGAGMTWLSGPCLTARRKRMWIFWDRLAPARPKWLHMVLCPFCRGYLLSRRKWLRSLP